MKWNDEAMNASDLKLEKSVEISTLCAFYGGLLTDKQRDALRFHYDEDLSLGEIAQQLSVSRQNVHELITRSAEKLYRYEKALGGVARARELAAILARANELLSRVKADVKPEALDALTEAMRMIAVGIQKQEGEENDHGL